MALRELDVVQSINLIAINPKIRNGRPHIIGTTLTVADVVIVQNYHHQDAAGIAEWYGISRAQVHAALAYYYEHEAEIDEQIATQIRLAEDLEKRRVGNERSLLPR